MINEGITNKMKKVVTFGVFDYFHLGHLRLFQRARALGDYLIVAVQDGDYILKYKPEANVLYTTEQRMEIIRALSIVDEVIIYTDVDQTIKTIDFDIFARGEDQNHRGFLSASDYAVSRGKEVIVLPRTKGISSSDIKRALPEN